MQFPLRSCIGEPTKHTHGYTYHYLNLLIASPTITIAIIMHAHSFNIWLKFNALCQQITSISLVNLLLLNIKIILSLRL